MQKQMLKTGFPLEDCGNDIKAKIMEFAKV